jgi:hypothetical protein
MGCAPWPRVVRLIEDFTLLISLRTEYASERSWSRRRNALSLRFDDVLPSASRSSVTGEGPNVSRIVNV